MHSSTSNARTTSNSPSNNDAESHELEHVIEHAGHLLPAQGPITVFIHHNTLHAFEHLPFNEAVQKGAQIFGCQPYLSEERYRDQLRRGRIRFSELREALEQDLGDRAGEEIPCFGSRLELRLAMLEYPLRVGPTAELGWYVAEENAMRKVREEISAADRERLIAETRRWVIRDLRGLVDSARNGSRNSDPSAVVPRSLKDLLARFDDAKMEQWTDEDWERFTLQALWRVCCEGVSGLPQFSQPPPEPIRHRDLLLEAAGVDTDLLVHEHLIRYCAAFLDQGLAYWELPNRDQGFYKAYLKLYRQPFGPPDRWRRGLAVELARLDDAGVGPLESITESLSALGIAADDRELYLSTALLALRGWAGMINQVETRGDRVVKTIPRGSLVEFMAIRLLLDRFALKFVARESIGFEGPLTELRDQCRRRIHWPSPASEEQRAFQLFQLAQLKRLSPDILYRMNKAQWRTMIEEIESFTGYERRRVFHLAYERRLYTQAADAVALHVRHPSPTPAAPRFQAVFCLDEREESIRRHLEEIAPEAATFGTAGFFSVPIYFRGVTDAHFVPLCPAVIQPRHWVVERVLETDEEAQKQRARTRRAIGMASHRFNVSSRSLTVGAILAGAVGVLASIPLVARTLFPRSTARLQRRLGRMMVESPPTTRLVLERSEPEPGPEPGAIGFSLDEMVQISEKVLRELGLTHNFSRLVFFVGHGSSSLNNPHKSAYDCGACGGATGGPNARSLAQMLNDPRVRDQLAARGLVVPAETRFVGGMHNTCNENLSFFDLDLLPDTHLAEFDQARRDFDRATRRNAHERSRRFEAAPLSQSPDAALEHVEGRSEDLAEVRPEWGHATNAICIVGRREKTRGLFLDRRSFLCSYDPTRDDERSSILTRILQAVFPVCGGISLEYYFSYVDNLGWGCGSKLPHNVTSLLGVMDGAASDLRTGLPWQMVEFHEPVRILFIIETTPEAMLGIIEANEGIGFLCRNRWVRLAVMEPETGNLQVFQGGEFRPYMPQAGVLPRARSSADWYRGWRDNLEFAAIESEGGVTTAASGNLNGDN